jgi:drug/metabolite transporter (DMT)-like permease
MASYTVNDVLVKALLQSYPVGETIFIRGVMCSVLIGAAALAFGNARALRAPMSRTLVSRSLCDGLSTAGFIAGLAHLKLANIAAVLQIAPLIITAMSVVLYREAVGWRRWTAIIIGFCGVLVVARPGFGGLHPAALLSLGATICNSFYVISTRILSRTDSNETTQFYTNLVGAVAMTLIVPFVWTPPDSVLVGGLMVLIGALGGGGHYLLIRAHRLAPASTLAPFIYTQMVWTTTLGFVAFGDVPHRWTIVGGLIVISSGLYLLHREAVRKVEPSAPVA